MNLCDFHREQAWERWVSTTEHGVTAVKGAVVSQLRKIARAPSGELYAKAVTDLKSSSVWLNNKRLRHWFENVWLRQHKVHLY